MKLSEYAKQEVSAKRYLKLEYMFYSIVANVIYPITFIALYMFFDIYYKDWLVEIAKWIGWENYRAINGIFTFVLITPFFLQYIIIYIRLGVLKYIRGMFFKS